MKAIQLKVKNWFLLRNSWFVSVSNQSTAFVAVEKETEGALQLKVWDIQTKKEWFVWIPKSAILNLKELSPD